MFLLFGSNLYHDQAACDAFVGKFSSLENALEASKQATNVIEIFDTDTMSWLHIRHECDRYDFEPCPNNRKCLPTLFMRLCGSKETPSNITSTDAEINHYRAFPYNIPLTIPFQRSASHVCVQGMTAVYRRTTFAHCAGPPICSVFAQDGTLLAQVDIGPVDPKSMEGKTIGDAIHGQAPDVFYWVTTTNDKYENNPKEQADSDYTIAFSDKTINIKDKVIQLREPIHNIYFNPCSYRVTLSKNTGREWTLRKPTEVSF